MVGFDVPHVAHDMMLRFMGVDFTRIREGTAGKIESSVGDNKHAASGSNGDSKLSEVEQAAKWQGEPSFVSIICALLNFTLSILQRRDSRPHRGAHSSLHWHIALLPIQTEYTLARGLC